MQDGNMKGSYTKTNTTCIYEYKQTFARTTLIAMCKGHNDAYRRPIEGPGLENEGCWSGWWGP